MFDHRIADAICAGLRRNGIWFAHHYAGECSHSDELIWIAKGLHIRVFNSGPRLGQWMMAGPTARVFATLRGLARDRSFFDLTRAKALARLAARLPRNYGPVEITGGVPQGEHQAFQLKLPGGGLDVTLVEDGTVRLPSISEAATRIARNAAQARRARGWSRR
jgi:hypothetical protein